jgi:hypothetical protein
MKGFLGTVDPAPAQPAQEQAPAVSVA